MTALFQPPEYHAHETFWSLRRSPMVGAVCSGTSRVLSVTLAGCGELIVYDVLMANPSGVTWPSLDITPFASSCARMLAGASGHVGAHAQIRNWWFRKEPPNAPWKKLSSMVYCWASLPSGMLVASK